MAYEKKVENMAERKKKDAPPFYILYVSLFGDKYSKSQICMNFGLLSLLQKVQHVFLFFVYGVYTARSKIVQTRANWMIIVNQAYETVYSMENKCLIGVQVTNEVLLLHDNEYKLCIILERKENTRQTQT